MCSPLSIRERAHEEIGRERKGWRIIWLSLYVKRVFVAVWSSCIIYFFLFAFYSWKMHENHFCHKITAYFMHTHTQCVSSIFFSSLSHHKVQFCRTCREERERAKILREKFVHMEVKNRNWNPINWLRFITSLESRDVHIFCTNRIIIEHVQMTIVYVAFIASFFIANLMFELSTNYSQSREKRMQIFIALQLWRDHNSLVIISQYRLSPRSIYFSY